MVGLDMNKKSEIKICGKFKKKKDIIKILKKYRKRGYMFRRIFKKKGEICMGFEEQKTKK